MSPNPARDFPEELADAYTPLRVLGRGAFGTVYLAVDRSLERRVAVKVLQSTVDREGRVRVAKAAASLARVEHPNVIRLYVHGFIAGGPYLVMEFLEGRGLDAGGADERPIEAMLQVADGLDAVHGEGLVHRDLKPANIIRTDGGRVVLIDFDLVYDPTRTQTSEGMLVGTLAYLAPELLRGTAPTPASDWYSWGVTLYSLIEGERPWSRDEVMASLGGTPLPPVPFSTLDPEGRAARLLRHCLSSDPAARPAGSRQVRRLLEGSRVRELPEPSAEVPAVARRVRVAGWDSTHKLARLEDSASIAHGSRRRVGALVAVALLASLLLGIQVGRRAGSSPSPTSPTTTSGPRPDQPPNPLGEDFAADVRASLADLSGVWIDSAGRRVDEPFGTPEEGVRPALDPDPRHWGEVLACIPEVRHFHAWLAEGGRPEELPPAVQDQLRDLDERFMDHGLERPFFPFVDCRPLATTLDTRPSNDPTRPLRGKLEWLPRAVTGWLAEAVRAGRAMSAEYHRLDRAVRSGDPESFPDDTPLGVRQYSMTLPGMGLRDMVRMVQAVPRHRETLATWFRTGSDELRTMLWATARSLREEPHTAARAELAAVEMLSDSWCFWVTAVCSVEPEVLLGAPPQGNSGYLLVATLHRYRIDGRRPVGAALEADVERMFRAYRHAQEIPARSETERALVRSALRGRFVALADHGSSEAVRAAYEETRPAFDTLNRAEQAHFLESVSRAVLRPDDPAELGESHVRWILSWFRSHIAEIPDPQGRISRGIIPRLEARLQ